MIESLRPMSLGELLDRTFLLYRRNFLLFVGIATVGPAAYLVFQLITIGSAVVPARTSTPSAVGLAAFGVGMLASLFIGIVVMLAGLAISQAATVRAVAAVHLGRTTTIINAYKALRGRIARVLAVFFLVMLLVAIATGGIVMVTGIVASLAVVGGAQGGTAGAVAGGLVAVVAVVIGVILAVTIYVRYSLSVQACVVEDLGVSASLKRSAILSKGARSRVLAVYFIFTILSVVIGFALSGAAVAVVFLIKNPILTLVVTYLASFVASSLTSPLATIGLSLLYYDERVRKEAFDLQLMMATLDEPGAVALPIQA